LKTRDLTVFAVFSAIMLLSRNLMQMLPGVHFLGLIIAVATLVYRVRALIPLYVYVFLDGLFTGFAFWWLPYLYIWLPLWLMFMLAGRLNLPAKTRAPLYMVLCGLHGLSFGTLYAPAQAVMFGLSFENMIRWIIAGLWFDVMHAIGNFAAGSLILPLVGLIRKLEGDRG